MLVNVSARVQQLSLVFQFNLVGLGRKDMNYNIMPGDLDAARAEAAASGSHRS